MDDRLRPARPRRRRPGRDEAVGGLHGGGAATPCERGRIAIAHLRIDPEIEADGGQDRDGATRHALRAAGWRRRRSDPAERDPDRRPHRGRGRALGRSAQEVAAVREQGPDRGITVTRRRRRRARPSSTAIYRETADRAGFLIRTEQAYRDIWDAYAPAGRARLLFARRPDGEAVATLFLVRCGTRVVEPYGGMTADGGESRANYLLKWEAIRSSREQGADELRPVGPRDRRDRPLQDRLRRPRGPLHRGVGPRPRSARPAGLHPRPAGPGLVRAATARDLAAAPAGERLHRGRRRLTLAPRGNARGAGRLGRAHGRRRSAATSSSPPPGPSTAAGPAGRRIS